MNDDERDALLIEVNAKVEKMATDIAWFKRIGSAAITLISVCLSVILQNILIH